MVPGFKLLFDCNNKLPKMKKEDINWALTDWVDYMDPDEMTTLLGGPFAIQKKKSTRKLANMH